MKPVIILPTKNRALLLKESLDNILSQKNTNFKLFLVDHNSSDGTRDLVERIAQKDKRVRYIHHIGYQDAAWSPKNAGLKILSKDASAVLFMDDDDRYSSPYSLGYLVDAARSMGSRFGICTGDYVELDVYGNYLKTTKGNILTTDDIAEKSWFPVKASIFNISLVREVCLLPPIRSRETILFAYFMVNIIERKYKHKKIFYTGKPIIKKVRHEGEISVENVDNGNREAAEVLIQNIHRCNLG